ncbi:hypothetical protein RUA4292_01368 [Ruegeria atlantica]|uniref:Uncharacterized protein n=1 Tax=Ruegeria atlantica TaxID=81569 RepID=A0A0P1ECJ3_9RHOB|nr:hypothetical protein RUA4292_01368 [Ruegeria atlantica]
MLETNALPKKIVIDKTVPTLRASRLPTNAEELRLYDTNRDGEPFHERMILLNDALHGFPRLAFVYIRNTFYTMASPQ